MPEIERSPNCNSYTSSVHTLVETSASAGGEERCKVDLPLVFSCQKSDFENVDEETASFLTKRGEEALKKMRCDTSDMRLSHHTTMVGAIEREFSARELSERGYASNCHTREGDATHTVNARCTNQYDFTYKGKRVRNSHATFSSTLAACDVSDKSMPQLYEDARKVAAHNARENGYIPERDSDFACTFSVLPNK